MSDILDQSVRAFCTATAAKQPTPGGGSVAGVAGALAAALGEMSLNYSLGKKAFAASAEIHAQLSTQLLGLRETFLRLIAEDMTVFAAYQAATELPDGPDKTAAEASTLAACIDVPRTMAATTLELLSALETLAPCCTKWLISDLLAAASLACATCDLCDFNVRINTSALPAGDAKNALLAASKADRVTARERFAAIEASVEL